jgi:predicted GNAT family acetyltransferase
MANQDIELQIRDNPAQSRYEAVVGGRLAMVEYLLTGPNITFSHTEVPEELEGRGIGGQLARFVLEDARARGLAVIPLCPFIKAYIARHPEYAPLVFGYSGPDARAAG